MTTHPVKLASPGSRRRRGPVKTAIGVLLTAIMLFPVYWMVNESFTPDRAMLRYPPGLFPVNGTLDGYRQVIDQQLPYLGTSLLVGVGAVALTLAFSAPAGYALGKLRPRGGAVVTFAMLAGQMIPGVIMAMGFYAIYLDLGIVNTVWGLIVADSTLAVPFGALVIAAFMSGIPDEVLQAARVDGASQWRTFRSVVLPLSRNALVTVGLFSFLWSWSDFVFASTVDSGGGLEPITLGIYHYIGNNDQQWNAVMATAVVASVPAAVLLVLAQKYVSAGVTAGAVKD
jgi:multiple sugar transport system permease protein